MIASAILTYQPETTGRAGLLNRTLRSLADLSPTVIENGSDEFGADVVLPPIAGSPHGNTCGYGMNKCAAWLVANTDADIFILSNDDIEWHVSADEIEAVWAEAPDEVAIISGLVEPTFQLPPNPPWNKPVGVREFAGRQVLFRMSVPGGAWTFRRKDYETIFPVPTFHGNDDVPTCHRLVRQGHGVAAVDWAEHIGVDQSTWGNLSHDRYIIESLRQVREQWGLD